VPNVGASDSMSPVSCRTEQTRSSASSSSVAAEIPLRALLVQQAAASWLASENPSGQVPWFSQVIARALVGDACRCNDGCDDRQIPHPSGANIHNYGIRPDVSVEDEREKRFKISTSKTLTAPAKTVRYRAAETLLESNSQNPRPSFQLRP